VKKKNRANTTHVIVGPNNTKPSLIFGVLASLLLLSLIFIHGGTGSGVFSDAPEPDPNRDPNLHPLLRRILCAHPQAPMLRPRSPNKVPRCPLPGTARRHRFEPRGSLPRARRRALQGHGTAPIRHTRQPGLHGVSFYIETTSFI